MGYSQAFHKEVERILSQIYHEPIQQVEQVVKRAVVQCEYRYVEYLVEQGLIKRLENIKGGNKFGLQLTNEGYKVFEEYGDWNTYYKKVITRKEKESHYKFLATKYWWVPIVISLVALVVSFL